MIKLTRTTDVALIPASLSGANRIKKNKELLLQQIEILKGTITKPAFNSDYWKAAKSAVKADSFNKCAYCESPTAVVAHGDIEHYRPKSIYWWLAYTYYNYCFACQICNQIYKGDNFPASGPKWKAPAVEVNTTITDEMCARLGPDPLTATAGLSLITYRANHKKEKTGLPDPYFEDAEKYFAWKADDTVREVFIIAISNSAISKYRVESAKQYFGLDRKELRVERYRVYSILKQLKKLLKSTGLSQADKADLQIAINTMIASDAPYAGMCRWFNKTL